MAQVEVVTTWGKCGGEAGAGSRALLLSLDYKQRVKWQSVKVQWVREKRLNIEFDLLGHKNRKTQVRKCLTHSFGGSFLNSVILKSLLMTQGCRRSPACLNAAACLFWWRRAIMWPKVIFSVTLSLWPGHKYAKILLPLRQAIVQIILCKWCCRNMYVMIHNASTFINSFLWYLLQYLDSRFWHLTHF